MTNIDATAEHSKEKTRAERQPKTGVQQYGRRREPWTKHAERFGISVRTLDRWVAQGIIPAPERIRGRKYGDPDTKPRIDVA